MADAYLDSNIVIALLEDDAARKSALLSRLAELTGADGRCVVSDLVRLECRVKPMATGDAALLHDYDDYFASPDVTCITLTASVFDQATAVRAAHRYPVADALHLAAALEAGCAVFVTADRQLSGFPGIAVALLSSA